MQLAEHTKGRVILFYSKLQWPQWPIWPPLDLYAIATALMNDGFEVTLVDSRAEENTRESLAQELEGALFIGISVMFGNQINNMLEDVEFIKSVRPDIPVVIGGWFPALFPDALFDSPLIDIVVVGPGDFNTPEIANRLLDGRSMEGIEGVYAREGDAIVRNPFGHLPDIRKTHRIPYEMLGIQRYIHPNGWLIMITSRGCPGQCNFCSISCLSPKRWTALRAERAVDELAELVALGAQAVRILDTDFCADIKRVEQICRLILERGLEVRWEILARHWNLRRMTDEQIKLMRWAGCTEIEVGVETGSQRLANAIVKDTVVEEVPHTLKRFVDNGIRWKVNFMFGIPTETDEDLKKTLRLVYDMWKLGEKAVHLQLFRYTPVPGGDKSSDNVWEQTTFDHEPTRLSLQELADFPMVDMDPVRMFWISEAHEVNVRRVHYFYAPLAFIPGCLSPSSGTRLWRFCLRLMRPLARWRIRNYQFAFPFEMWLNERFGFSLPHATDDSIGPHDDVLAAPQMGMTISDYEPLQPKVPKPGSLESVGTA
ncbi:MAG: radical SAM protein [Planctomycetota bacterium]